MGSSLTSCPGSVRTARPLEFFLGGWGDWFSFLFSFINKCPPLQGMWESFMNTEKGVTEDSPSP